MKLMKMMEMSKSKQLEIHMVGDWMDVEMLLAAFPCFDKLSSYFCVYIIHIYTLIFYFFFGFVPAACSISSHWFS